MADGSRSFNFPLTHHTCADVAVGLRATYPPLRDLVAEIDLVGIGAAA
jgi:hypothetical protein